MEDRPQMLLVKFKGRKIINKYPFLSYEKLSYQILLISEFIISLNIVGLENYF
jgi:hypothetical protein